MKTNKIVINVSGGVVQDVYATDPAAIRVVLVDEDNLEENFNREQREEILTHETEGLTAVLIEGSKAEEDQINKGGFGWTEKTPFDTPC
jgi:hypothetical protein